MPKLQPPNTGQQVKTIQKLEARILTLNKAVAALSPLCDCETKYSPAEEMALAERLAALWAQDFQQELETGVRASMDDMGPPKACIGD